MENNKPTISILVPGIRCEKWLNLYNSVEKSLESDDFEVLFVGPWDCIESKLRNAKNVKFIRSWRHPTASQQLGLTYSEAKYCTAIADDCLFEAGALKRVVESLDKFNYDVIVTKYGEGGDVMDDWRYTYGASYPKSPHINPNWVIFNSAVFNTEYLKSLGGWDCSFAVTCISMADLGSRAHLNNVNVAFNTNSLCRCGWLEGRSGDHFAVHDSQIFDDEPLFRTKWNTQTPPDIKIDINNWKLTDRVWARRFG